MSVLSRLKALTRPRFAMYVLAKKYIKRYEGFSYDASKNGERHLLDILSREDINVVFDVGANIGDWSKDALDRFPQARIHSFELSNSTFVTLRDNLSGESRIVLNNCGLSNEQGQVTYKDYGENSGVNTIIAGADFHDASIQPRQRHGVLTTGDAYCRENGIGTIDLLKIDVEGAEHLVLEGFAEMLAKKAIMLVQFEYGYTHADAKFLVKDFYRLFEQYGYVLGPLKPTGVLFMDFVYPLNDFNSGPNYVAVRSDDRDLIGKVSGLPLRGFPR